MKILLGLLFVVALFGLPVWVRSLRKAPEPIGVDIGDDPDEDDK